MGLSQDRAAGYVLCPSAATEKLVLERKEKDRDAGAN